MKVVVVQQDLVTAWGRGMEACWAGLLSGAPAFTEVTRFSTKAFQAHLAAQVPGLPEGGDASRVMRMLNPLLAPLAGTLPEGTLVLLATTTGEVDLLERAMEANQSTQGREVSPRPPVTVEKDGCLGEASLPSGEDQSNKGREVSPRPPVTVEKDGCLGEASLPSGEDQSNKGREVSPRPPVTVEKDGCLGEASLPSGEDQSNKGREVSPRPPVTVEKDGCLGEASLPSGEDQSTQGREVSPRPPEDQSRLDVLLGRIQSTLGVTEPGRIISAACASSAVAIAQGATLIAAGERDSVLVVACDAVTEFIYAGFASLMALDPEGARPFDKARKGLTVGEAAGIVWLMSEDRARRENRPSQGEVAGWGLSCDANHMTGPSRDGGGLVRAIEKALQRAGLSAGAIGSVSAHGTGTLYNDSMELKAFQTVFTSQVDRDLRARSDAARRSASTSGCFDYCENVRSEKRVPVYSVKGSLGHTMRATGLVQMMVALKSMERQVVPPSANLHEVDPEAVGWVSKHAVKVEGMNAVLSTNSGFGGVNAALVLKS